MKSYLYFPLEGGGILVRTEYPVLEFLNNLLGLGTEKE
jgi:hypothetical protein